MRCLFLLSLSLQVAGSATAATYTDSWLFFTSLSTTQFHNKLPSCFQYCITCRQSNKKSKNVSPDTKLLLLCQPGRVGNKADEPLNKWCFIKIHCKKTWQFQFLVNPLYLNHMHWSRNFWESFSVDSLSPFKEPSLSMDPYVWIVFSIVSSLCT